MYLVTFFHLVTSQIFLWDLLRGAPAPDSEPDLAPGPARLCQSAAGRADWASALWHRQQRRLLWLSRWFGPRQENKL